MGERPNGERPVRGERPEQVRGERPEQDRGEQPDPWLQGPDPWEQQAAARRAAAPGDEVRYFDPGSQRESNHWRWWDAWSEAGAWSSGTRGDPWRDYADARGWRTDTGRWSTYNPWDKDGVSRDCSVSERPERHHPDGTDFEEKDKDDPAPAWDGSGPLLMYIRRIDLWVASTRVAPRRRGAKLLAALTGDAFDKMEFSPTRYIGSAAWRYQVQRVNTGKIRAL